MVINRPSCFGSCSRPPHRPSLGKTIQETAAQVGVDELAPAEHDGHLGLVALGEEAANVAALVLKVVLLRLGRISPLSP